MAIRSQPPLILASASPRRRDLLIAAGIEFEVQTADLNEAPRLGEEPLELASRLAREKALSVARTRTGPDPRVVLGADTIVVLDNRVFGKPRDPAHARQLLRHLLGRTHSVITAIAVTRSDRQAVREVQVESRVSMRTAADAEIEAYVATGEPLDKAGAYAVQGVGRRFIERVEGSETNVIGLPIDETLALLRVEGIGVDS